MTRVTNWELRRKLRWGSEHRGWFASRRLAEQEARRDIEAHGNVGRLECVTDATVYYDIYEELS